MNLLQIFLIISWLSVGFFTTTVAESKNYNGYLWFVLGLFFGPIALLSIVGMPNQASRKYLRVIAEILDEMESVQQ